MVIIDNAKNGLNNIKRWLADWYELIGIGAVVLLCASAWLTHIVWGITKLASDAGITFGQFLLGIVGMFLPPIGIIHGIIIWFS